MKSWIGPQVGNTLSSFESDWGGCSERCGPGVQERMRLSHNKDGFSIQKMSRSCQLPLCTNRKETELNCFFTTVKGDSEDDLINICKCPNASDVVCSSIEARDNMSSWLPDFRAYCNNELAKDPTIDLFPSELYNQRRALLGRFIRVGFTDGYYFDCEENWGILQKGDVHSYCKIGVPLICKPTHAVNIKNESLLEYENIILKDTTNNVRIYKYKHVWFLSALLFIFIIYKLIFNRKRKKFI